MNQSNYPEDFFDEAFNRVTLDIEWSSESREQVKLALIGVLNAGAWKANKVLMEVWPSEFYWPAATAYLEVTRKKVKPTDYTNLLRCQVSHVQYWLHRADQISGLYDSDFGRRNHPYVVIDGDHGIQCDRCGAVMSVDDFLASVPEPCLVFGCACVLETLSHEDLSKWEARRG